MTPRCFHFAPNVRPAQCTASLIYCISSLTCYRAHELKHDKKGSVVFFPQLQTVLQNKGRHFVEARLNCRSPESIIFVVQMSATRGRSAPIPHVLKRTKSIHVSCHMSLNISMHSKTNYIYF